MKELSIEQKAKRYDEAIKLAKDSYNYPSYPGFIRADVVFPELKESEDLEEAVNAYIGYAPEVDESSSTYGKRQAFKAGANWQEQKDKSKVLTEEQCRKLSDDAFELGKDAMKQRLMAKAVDAVVKVDAGGYPYIDRTIELYDYDKDIPLAKEGDKYKVILIKEGWV